MTNTTDTARGALDTVEEFFHRLGTGDRTGTVELFADQVDWNVPGADVVPWSGRRSTKREIGEFLAMLQTELTPEHFSVDQIVVDGEHAVALGSFAFGVVKTGKHFTSGFALHFTVRDGLIQLYHIYEDSHAVAEAVSA